MGKILDSQIIDKARLFIKSDEFIDGALGFNTNLRSKKTVRDVVSKCFIPGMKPPVICSRCRGKSEVTAGVLPSAPGSQSVRWITWERQWYSHCICGGLWMSEL